MSMLAVPSLFALIIKGMLFAVIRDGLFRRNTTLAVFLATLFMLNLAEFILLVNGTSPGISLWAMKGYYVAAVFTAATFLALALSLYSRDRLVSSGFLVAAGLLSAFIIAGDDLIAGAQPISYSVTRVPGDYYWVIQAFVILSTLSGLVVLGINAVRSPRQIARQKSTVILIGTAPMGIFIIGIIIAMALGYRVNATVIQSLLSTLLLAILIFTEAKYHLFRFLSYVPLTPEYKIRTKAQAIVAQAISDLYENHRLALKELRSEFEATLIELAIQSTDGNKTHAARVLGIGKATLHRKIEGLDI